MNDKMENQPSANMKYPLWLSCRLGVTIMGFLGLFCAYAVRVNLNVAIVCMMNHTAVRAINNIAINYSDNNMVTVDDELLVQECGGGISDFSQTEPDLNPLNGHLVWDKVTQGHVLGAFYYGYAIGQIPLSWLATRFGFKWMFGIFMLLSAIGTMLIPILAETHYIAIILMRILIGFSTSLCFPCGQMMISKWAPTFERTTLLYVIYAGGPFGIFVTFSISGLLCNRTIAGEPGWPFIFYVTGGACFIWSVAWFLLVSESPDKHTRISRTEKEYISNSTQRRDGGEDAKTVSVAWKQMLTSLPVWAIILCIGSIDWGASTLLVNIPTYLDEIHHFDIASNGVVSALPYLAFFLVIVFGGRLADLLMERRLLTTVVARKLFNAIGMVLPAILLVGLGYVDCSTPYVAVVLLVLGVALTGLQFSGSFVNPVDIAPSISGIVFGIANTVAAITGFITPVIVGIITEHRQTRAEWQTVFYISAGIYVAGAIFFNVFADGNIQPWTVKQLEIEILEEVSGRDVMMEGNKRFAPEAETIE